MKLHTGLVLAIAVVLGGVAGAQAIHPLNNMNPTSVPFSVGGNLENQRGWMFQVNIPNVTVVELGANTPIINSHSETLILWDVATQTQLANVPTTPGMGAGWQFVPITPVPLTQGSQYIVSVYTPNVGQNTYYFRNFSPPSPWLPTGDIQYITMRYNNGGQGFPTSSLTNYQYGVPDFGYVTSSVFLRTVASATVETFPGDTGITATATVENTGGNTIDINLIDLTFEDSLNNDVTAEYTVTPDPGNPTTVASGVTETFTFTVDVGATATLDMITVDGTVDYTDQVTMGTGNDTGADTTHQWNVRGAEPMVRTVDATPTQVAQGGTGYPVSVTIENVGLAEMTVGAVTFTFMGMADRTPEYTVNPDPGNPTTIAVGVTETFNFTVDVDVAASLETITIDAGVDGTTTANGAPCSDPDADTTDSWLVVTCAPTLCGDCNVDGVVNILDALMGAQNAALIIALAGQEFTNCNVIGDLEPSPSAVVDILDALTIAQFAAQLPVTLTCC